jgi:hypothetical protein
MITKKVKRFGDADFDEYSFLYSQRELAIRTTAPTASRLNIPQPMARGPNSS